jgi:Flp pilus assembly protein TadD
MRTDFYTTIRALHEASTRRRDRNIKDDPIALFGGAFALAGDFERAMLHIDRALTLDGACAWARNRLGLLKVYRDNYSDATEASRIARSLDALNPIFRALRSSEGSGRPLGNADFIADLERLLGRPVARRAPGRKSKSAGVEQLDLLK